eukprot:2502200-Rhodomonas_salina.1
MPRYWERYALRAVRYKHWRATVPGPPPAEVFQPGGDSTFDADAPQVCSYPSKSALSVSCWGAWRRVLSLGSGSIAKGQGSRVKGQGSRVKGLRSRV